MSRISKFFAHVMIVFCAFLLAYQLRRALPVTWWFEGSDALRVVRWAALYAGIAGGVELISQTERGAWRFSSAREAVSLLRSMTLTVLLFILAIFFVDRGLQLPRSVLPLAWLLSFLFLVGVRLMWRLAHDRSLAASLLPDWWLLKARRGLPLLIVGDMAEAERHVRHLKTDPEAVYWPAAVITPNSGEEGLQLHGVPCLGAPEQLERVIAAQFRDPKTLPAILFLEDPVSKFGFSVERIGRLRRAGHSLLRPQSIMDLDDESKSSGSRLREIQLEEFLPRAPVSLDPAPLRALVGGKRVLVTGAGGSIGSEIARQLVGLGCANLTLIDHSEFLLFEVDRELSGVKSQTRRRAVLANVRDQQRVAEVFRQEEPEIVFHAAALKHVVMVENNPSEGVLTNVMGTRNVIEAAVACGANQFVLISTDKAVAPSNVMGSTKRIAEALLDLTPKSKTRLCAVRFGNVLGSAGSVVPIFQQQIAEGGPVTVTHPDVDRYFMTIPEAVQLVLHSTVINSQRSDDEPGKFLLEMGNPVKIADLARQMIELSGNTPDVDIMIEFSGLKSGEKMSEVLFDDGEEVSSCSDGVMQVMSSRAGPGITAAGVQAVIDGALQKNDEQLKSLIAGLVSDIRR